MKIKYLFMGLVLFMFSVKMVYAQTGINTKSPNQKTLLHISEKSTPTSAVEKKGIIIPRLTEAERDEIVPSPSENSLLIYNTTEQCYNYWNSEESEWKSLCGSLGKSIFTIDCSEIIVGGVFENDKELTAGNYLRLNLNVTKPGSYDFVAVTDNNNGYFFQASGTFYEAGNYTLNLLGSGTPTNFTPAGEDGDKIILSNFGEMLCDNKNIFVNDATILPTFRVNCQSIVINGTYTVNQNLTSVNTIKLTINSNVSAVGAPFQIETQAVNGYSFKASGILNGGDQEVTLIGTGKPINNGSNSFTLVTNSTLGSSSCAFDVKVAARKMKIVGIANNDNSYNIGRTDNFLQQVMKNDNYFANNQQSTYPVNGFEFLGVYNFDSGSQTTVNNFDPDIVLIQYNEFTNNVASRDFLKSLLDRGVVVIYCSDGDGATATRNVAAREMVNLALGETTMTVTGTVDSDLMEIIDTGTMITSGPFMNLAGNSMGRDAGNNFGFELSTFPFDKASIIAYQNNTRNSVRGFVSKINGFVFFGDGAPFAANEGTQAYNWPAKFRTTNGVTVAIANVYGTTTSYNSFLFLNLMSWAINYAQTNR